MNSRLSPRMMAAIACVALAIASLVTLKLNQPGLANGSTLFQVIRPTLERSGIPLRLPTYIPEQGQRPLSPGVKPPSVYASAPYSQPQQGYLAVLGYTSDCDGGNSCRFGTVSGIPRPSMSVEDDYKQKLQDQIRGIFQKRQSEEPFSQVNLAKGITGYFVPWTCTNICTDAEVIWDESFYRYSVGIKLGEKASLVKMANSAIESNR